MIMLTANSNANANVGNTPLNVNKKREGQSVWLCMILGIVIHCWKKHMANQPLKLTPCSENTATWQLIRTVGGFLSPSANAENCVTARLRHRHQDTVKVDRGRCAVDTEHISGCVVYMIHRAGCSSRPVALCQEKERKDCNFGPFV